MYGEEYTCRLKPSGRFTIPPAYRKQLFRDSGQQRRLVFAAGDTLRVYPDNGLPLYCAEMARLVDFCGRQDAAPLQQLTQKYGAARWTLWGTATIPQPFLRQYGLTPGMELLLAGNQGYFEIIPHKHYNVSSQALQDELGLRNSSISQRQARNVADITLEGAPPAVVKELRPFNQLSRLSLVDCSLTDIGFLAELPHLRNLCLWKNHIRDISPVERLSRLESLHIAQNPVTELLPVTKLKLLKRLAAFDCKISHIPAFPPDCRLQALLLSDNRLTDLRFLMDVTQLEELRLNNNSVCNLHPLAGMQKLKYLHIANNRVENIDVLLTLPSLCGATVSGNPIAPPERQKLLVHTVLNKYPLTVLGASAYRKKRAEFLKRYAGEAVDEELAGLLYSLTHIRCEEEVTFETESRYTARARYPLTENQRALDKVLAMAGCFEKQCILRWIREQEPVRVPVAIDREEAFSAGKSGSLQFSITPGGIIGPGEPYTIDRSTYTELRVYPACI